MLGKHFFGAGISIGFVVVPAHWAIRPQEYLSIVSIASTPEPPYYSVIFTSLRTGTDEAGYLQMANRMNELAASQDGFLGVESVRDADGCGITVSYWRDLQSIRDWRAETEHQAAQAAGRTDWYSAYRVRISRVERDYGFQK